MAKVTVKLFGVLRIDSRLVVEQLEIERVSDIFDTLNKRAAEAFEKTRDENPAAEKPAALSFRDAVVFINGERCPKKGKKLNDNDEVWLLSPASGG
jgi:molybdopterin converting factor small subunit